MKKPGMIFVRWANRCNNNCEMCSLHSDDSRDESMSFEEAAEFTIKNIDEYSNIEFTGGEPTIKEGLLELVALAKKTGYDKICISTNGRRLSDENFCHALAENGLNVVTFALHGHNAETHERMSRVIGSFEESMEGIKNVLNEPTMALAITSVLSRHNHETFSEIGKMLIEMGVKQWSISDLIPDGRAQDIYDSLSLSPSEMGKSLAEAIPLFPGFYQVGIFNFSRCFFPEELYRNVAFFDTKAKADLWDIEGKEGRYEKEGEVYHDFHKTYLGICEKCPAYETCGGVWKRSLELYGPSEMEKIARVNGFVETV
ncbi:MAG: radical SAM protein [Candidatus Colwellbacteria bacterium]|nr:radical SAM protein [Candidatus Colwellbacteria bacterium]